MSFKVTLPFSVNYYILNAIKYPSDSRSGLSRAACPPKFRDDFWCLLEIIHSACQSANQNVQWLIKKCHFLNLTQQKQSTKNQKQSYDGGNEPEVVKTSTAQSLSLYVYCKKASPLQGVFVGCRAACREFVGVFFLRGSEDQLTSEEEIGSSDLTLRRFIVYTSSLQTIRAERMNRRVCWKVRPDTRSLGLSLYVIHLCICVYICLRLLSSHFTATHQQLSANDCLYFV